MANVVVKIMIIISVLIIVIVAAVTVASALYSHRVDKEAQDVLTTANLEKNELILESDLAVLPSCVKTWMERSGGVGKEKIHTVRLTQIGRMRSEEGKPWIPVEAVQYINVDQPGFVWKAKAKPGPLLSMVVRDKYYKGKGSMQVKLLALFPVVNAKPCIEMNQGTLLRFLAEMIWYPTAALNDYITWEEIDANSARATMTWQGVKASMVFNFDDNGDIVNNVATRYREENGKFVLDDWGGVVRGNRKFNGMMIFNKIDIIWKYKTGDFNWLQIEVTDIDYNPTGLW